MTELKSNKYFELVEEVDKKVEELTNLHEKNLQCKMGCDLCCMDYSIFPVEFYSILNRIKEDNISAKTVIKNDNSCVFLKDHKCTIYKYRPIICRTHGLPLIYMNDESEWELSNCELNFREFDFEEFTFDNTFPQDKFNSKLYLLNKDFISDFKSESYKETDLIPIKALAKQIR